MTQQCRLLAQLAHLAAEHQDPRCVNSRYSAEERVNVHDFYLRILDDATVTNKVASFEAGPRSRGIKWSTVHRWSMAAS